MSILSKERQKKVNNKGLSLVELIVVIAIIAVMIGLIGLGIGLLFGTEASQAARKTDAQLNDIKTGAMTRASEYMIIRYIDISSLDKATQQAAAEQGIDRPGFYAEKHIATLKNDDPATLKVDYGGVEYTRIGSKKVTINAGTTEITSDGANGVRIEYDRKTGKLYDVEIVPADGTPTPIAASVTPSATFALDKMTFKVGLRTYEIEFDSATGRHKIK